MAQLLALFDIDNTIYDGFSYFGLLEKQTDEGLIGAHVLGKARSSMQKYTSGAQDYEMTIIDLLNIYAAGLKGCSYISVLQSTKEFYASSSHFYSYVAPTIQFLQATHDVALVTGEPQFIAEAVGELYGITLLHASKYEVQDGVFTGSVYSYLADRQEKHDTITQTMRGRSFKDSFAFGDSEGDIEMLRAVTYPICLNPTAGLRNLALKEGWHIADVHNVQALVEKLHARIPAPFRLSVLMTIFATFALCLGGLVLGSSLTSVACSLVARLKLSAACFAAVAGNLSLFLVIHASKTAVAHVVVVVCHKALLGLMIVIS